MSDTRDIEDLNPELQAQVRAAAAAGALKPNQSLNFAMDPDRRMALAIVSTERGRFEIAPPPDVIVPIPFHILKQAVAQILEVEVGIALAKLPGGKATPMTRWPKGMRGVKVVAEKLMESAMLEAAGEALTPEDNAPAFKPNLDLIV